MNKRKLTEFLIGIVAIFLSLLVPLSSLGNTCVESFDSRLDQLWKVEVLREIETIRNGRFDEVLIDIGHRFYEGDSVTIKGEFFVPPSITKYTLTVKKWLGSGEEGEVYLVQSYTGQLFVLKRFYEKEDALDNYEAIEAIGKKMPNAIISTKAFSEKKGILLLDFINGETLHDVFNSPSLPKRVREKLENDFKQLSNQAIENGFFGIIEANILVRFSDLKLFIIDPY